LPARIQAWSAPGRYLRYAGQRRLRWRAPVTSRIMRYARRLRGGSRYGHTLFAFFIKPRKTRIVPCKIGRGYHLRVDMVMCEAPFPALLVVFSFQTVKRATNNW
jgi:hypothetical protein